MSLPPECYVLGFQEIDQTQVAVVEGKGAQPGELGRLSRLNPDDQVSAAWSPVVGRWPRTL
jgi:hypothetical protein